MENCPGTEPVCQSWENCFFFLNAHLKNHKANQKTGKNVILKEENKLAETIPKETQTSDLLEKNSKISVLKMLKELKRNTEK